MGKRGPKPQSAVVAIAKRILISDEGCWEWEGVRMENGYGKVGHRGKCWLAHRLSYTAFVGPIPEGLTIDHLCRNRACVRPGHMEPVTQRVNTLRGIAPTAENARKTHCPRGHELAGSNLLPTLLARGQRSCRLCHNARMVISGARYKARKRREALK